MKKILLVGYMGSGKSEIGKLLAKEIDFEYSDLDDLIENHQQNSVSEIFKSKGEIYFRKIEHQLFAQKLNSDKSFILSLGGGTPCYSNNHLELLRDDVISIYLKASIDTLVNRLSNNKEKRPIITNLSNDEMHEFIAKHLFDRSYFYNQSKIKISVDDKSPTDIVQEIKKILF